MTNANPSVVIDTLIKRVQNGDGRALEQLLDRACERLTYLARRMLKDFGRVKRWEETADVLQNSLLRLYRAMSNVRPSNAVEFYRLAAVSIRRELLDLARHYYGPQGWGANYASIAQSADSAVVPSAPFAPPATVEDPGRLEAWAAFHERVERLPDEERDVFDLLWYQQLPQAEIAALLNVSERTVKRRWASARLMLQDALRGQSPES